MVSTFDFFAQGAVDADTLLVPPRNQTTRWAARQMVETANASSKREQQTEDTQHEQRRSGSMNIYAERGRGQGGESTVNDGDGTKQDPAYKDGIAAKNVPQNGLPKPGSVMSGNAVG